MRWISAIVLTTLLGGGWMAGQVSNPPASSRPSAGMTHDQIWQLITSTLRQRGIHESELPAEGDLDYSAVVPFAPGSALQLISIDWDALQNAWQFRLRCQQPGQCIPFLVGAPAGEATFSRWKEWTNAAPSKALYRRASDRSNERIADMQAATPPMVKAGDAATLYFEGKFLRITVPVICLERGGQGQQVRVRSRHGNQVFRARVAGGGRLETAIYGKEKDSQ